MAEITHEQHDDLGASHVMWSRVTLRDNVHLDGETLTKSGNWLGGFTGGVNCLFYDQNRIIVGMSNIHQFSIDGGWFGRNERRDWWGEDMDPETRAKTADFMILEFWAPRYGALQTIVGHAAAAAEELEPVIQQLKDAGILNGVSA